MALAPLTLAAAAFAYAVGGFWMKRSAGATHPGATAVFLALFTLGAVLQARGMRGADLSVAYIVVLGLEAVAAVGLGTVVLHEPLTAPRVVAVLLILAGVVWLQRT